MALSTVTLQWDLADLIQSGIPATLSITPTAQMSDTADHILIPPVARTWKFTGGTGSLAGIVANDNAAIAPAGTGYLISVTDDNGKVIVPQFQTQILTANGSMQWLDALAVVPVVTTAYQYLPLPSGTPAAGQVPVATGSGEASAWGNVGMTALGDMIYGGSSPAGIPSRLAGNTSTTPELLTSTGTGSAANTPAWQSAAALGLTSATGGQGAPQAAGTVTGQVQVDSLGTPWTWNGSAWRMGPSGQTEHLLSGNAKPEVNPVMTRTVQNAAPWLAWLTQYGASGIITETSIPSAGSTLGGYTATAYDTLRWSEVAEEFYRLLDDYSIPVIHYGVNPTGGGALVNPGQVYLTGTQGNATTVTVQPAAMPSADDAVIPMLRHTRSASRGLELGSVVGVTPPGGYSNSSPYSASTWTCVPETYSVAYAAGARICRISTRWETVQQTLLGALDTAELARLDAAITAAGNAGLKVILDLHNYCSYVTSGGTLHIGDGTLTQAQLVDVWTKLSTHYKGNANIYAYELMNEPSQLPATSLATVTTNTGTLNPGQQITVASTAAFPQTRPFGITLVTTYGTAYASASVTNSTTLTIVAVALGGTSTWSIGAALDSPQLAWETISQAVVTGIRGNSDTTPVAVAGYYYQKAPYFPVNHPVPWIADSASATMYAAHYYWSSNSVNGDSYYQAWATELAQTLFTGAAGGGGYFPMRAEHPFMGVTADRIPMQWGEETMSRLLCTGATSGMTTSDAYVTCFIAGREELVNFVTLDVTSIHNTPTTEQVGIYAMGPGKDMTLIAVSANGSWFGSTGQAKIQVSAGTAGVLTASAASFSAGTVTLTLPNVNGFAVGQQVYVKGTANSGQFTVASVNTGSSQITYAGAAAPTGTVTVGISLAKIPGQYLGVAVYQNASTTAEFAGLNTYPTATQLTWPYQSFMRFTSSGMPPYIAGGAPVTTANAFWAWVTPA